jgi:pimeloyl-ACP methyl ester carboxylesterase
MRSLLCLSLALLALLPRPACAQYRKEGIIIFKDGFSLSGKVVEKRDYIIDPVAGQSITIPLSGGLINLDDIVRRMYFIPGQLQEVLDKKNIDRNLIELRRFANTSQPDKILPGWQVESFTPWNSKWERNLKVHVVRTVPNYYSGYIKGGMDQRIVRANPQFLHIQTLKYDWDLYHLTREFSPEEIRGLLTGYFSDKKNLKDWEKRKQIAVFLHQAGWHKEAQKELDGLVEEFPSQKEDVAGLRETIKKVLADIYVEDMERAAKVGQHQEAQDRLAVYAKDDMASLVSEENVLRAAEIKTKYDAQGDKIAQAKMLLQALPKLVPAASKKVWTNAAERILQELNYDTFPRLETFLTFGQQHLREVKDKVHSSQQAEEVLALAVSGWLLGNAAAEADVQNAFLLLRTRDMVLEYQKTENTVLRAKMLMAVFQGSSLSLDVLARMIKNLPPPRAYDKTKIGSRPIKLDIDIADSKGGTYYVQLPPEYHHERPYPVLLMLHGAREKPDAMLERISDLAAQQGFILAAPLWSAVGHGAYTYTPQEHAIVLDTLRDLRRRFQVDSDRVFLFGWEQGGDAAFDIGMGHPDQFAGVLPMCGVPRYFTGERDRYASNAQYLPFYMVEGDRHGGNPNSIRKLFKEWVSGAYPALYVEYKGRGSEWYLGELPRMFDWMSHKKRFHPNREMGRRHTGGGVGEEFRTLRSCDNRFYWLSTDDIDPRHLNNAASWVRATPPATMLANISVGNELISKAGGQKEAKILTNVNIQTKGLRQLTVWLAPSMVDFSKPIRVRVNGTPIGGERIIAPNPSVLMEDFFYNGDRERLYYARVDLRF